MAITEDSSKNSRIPQSCSIRLQCCTAWTHASFHPRALVHNNYWSLQCSFSSQLHLKGLLQMTTTCTDDSYLYRRRRRRSYNKCVLGLLCADSIRGHRCCLWLSWFISLAKQLMGVTIIFTHRDGRQDMLHLRHIVDLSSKRGGDVLPLPGQTGPGKSAKSTDKQWFTCPAALCPEAPPAILPRV